MILARSILRAACFFVGVCGALLLCELALRLLPVNGGAYTADPDKSWPASRLVPHSDYTFSDGWSLRNAHHGRINNFGYAAPFNYVPGSKGVVIIGDELRGITDERLRRYAPGRSGPRASPPRT